jgi:hypothetical protein
MDDSEKKHPGTWLPTAPQDMAVRRDSPFGRSLQEFKVTDVDKKVSVWLTRDVEGKKPYVRATTALDRWELFWPDASGNGHDAVAPITPAAVTALLEEEQRLLARVRVLEDLGRQAVYQVGDGYTWSEKLREVLGIAPYDQGWGERP